MNYSIQKTLQMFGSPLSKEKLLDYEKNSLVPRLPRTQSGQLKRKSWTADEIHLIGEKIGFLRKPTQPTAISVFVTKGGVLKTSLTMNLARIAALHNIKTLVVGLDMQADITTALNVLEISDEQESLEEALERINQTQGLSDYFEKRVSLDEIIQDTDLPCLKVIPETPELVALDQSLMAKNRREYWLKDEVIDPLKKNFDLILMDCSPNWNRLITNSLTACDVLLSPLECKISNLRNLKVFRAFVKEFQEDMKIDFQHIYVGTRFNPQRKLSREIHGFYQAQLENFIATAIRESTQGEEAVALNQSLIEYAPNHISSDEMRSIVLELWNLLLERQNLENKTLSDERIIVR